MDSRTVLLTGATGFVGGALRPRLEALGLRVRLASRRPPKGPGWVEFDLDRPETLPAALHGCQIAFHLVHGMGDGPGYAEREARGARAFREAAAHAGVERIVYLGGVEPAGIPSPHLASRIETGRILRGGPVPTVELRAAMVAGPGSTSWQIVRDLAARLPAMLLPAWLRFSSWPVYVDDICAALIRAMDLPLPGGSAWFDAPGPERVSHAELIRRVAAHMHRKPRTLSLPVLSPRLSAYWIAFVTRADLPVALELVKGLGADLDPTGPLIWEEMPVFARTGLDETIDRCLAADVGGIAAPQDLWRFVERRLRREVSGAGPSSASR